MTWARSALKHTRRRHCIVLDAVTVVSAYLVLCGQVDRCGVTVVFQSLVCLECQGSLASNGRYTRTWIDVDFLVVRLCIFRLRCRICHVGWTLLPGFVLLWFQYSPRLIQRVCWALLSGQTAGAVRRRLLAAGSGILSVERYVPAESTLRHWLEWLGSSAHQHVVRLTLSFVARVAPDGGRAALYAVVDPVNRAYLALREDIAVRWRAGKVLRCCTVLDSCLRGKPLRRRPDQVRDWGLWLFREHRQVLCRSA